MTIYRATVIGLAVQTLGLAAFAYLGQVTTAAWPKQAALWVTLVAMGILVVRFNWSFSVGRAALLSVLLALGYVGGHVLLGVTVYPGMLKDLTSPADIVEALWPLLCLLAAAYFVASLAVAAMRRIADARRSGRSGALDH